MSLLLEWKTANPPWVDLQNVSFDALATVDLASAASFRASVEGKSIPLRELFSITELDSKESDLEIPTVIARGDFSRALRMGTRLQHSCLIVDGNAGDGTGRQMNGGAIYVLGEAGNYVAEDMKKGTLCILGNCGDRLAGPSSGRLKGMEGGDILVYGSVGDRLCERIRRGTVFVAGDIGAYACHQMIAGTVVCQGEVGASCCSGMRRGTLIASQLRELLQDGDSVDLSTRSLPGMFTNPRPFELSFLPLLWKHLQSIENRVRRDLTRWGYEGHRRLSVPNTRWVHRMLGDLQVEGRGEILLPIPPTSFRSQP